MRLTLLFLCLFAASAAHAQDAPSMSEPPHSNAPAPTEQTPPPPPPPSQFDPALFQKPIPAPQLAFLTQFDNAPATDLYRDKNFRKLLKSIVPDCMFHYGSDTPLSNALDQVFDKSRIPVHIRDDRYLLVAGTSGPFLGGRGFVWIDLQSGIALGGFSFHPTNGEPSPTLVIFSRQVKDGPLGIDDMPPAFAKDLARWSYDAHIPPVLTRYFITGGNRRILLEHDEDFCSPTDGSLAPRGADCDQMNLEAAEDDLNAAYYLQQVNYRTNATAWMIGPDERDFLSVRDRTCGGIANPLACRIRLTHERIHVIAGRPIHQPVRH